MTKHWCDKCKQEIKTKPHPVMLSPGKWVELCETCNAMYEDMWRKLQAELRAEIDAWLLNKGKNDV